MTADSAPLAAAPLSAANTARRGGRRRELHPLPLFDTAALTALLVEHGIKAKWATLIQQTLLHDTPAFTSPSPDSPPPTAADLYPAALAHLTSLSSPPPTTLLPLLLSHTAPLTSRVDSSSTSSDSSTTKLLVRLSDSQLVEAVIIRHRAKSLPFLPSTEESKAAGDVHPQQPRPGRITLCVSSQIGCRQACTFCATGTLGLRGHLYAGEVVEQLLHANRLLSSSYPPQRVSNVVFMGQGEPLDNYAAVLGAVSAFTGPLLRLSPARVTVSTVGVTRRIVDLISDAPHVQLAVSLHAPNQALRLRLVPSSAAYTLPRLMDALHAYTAALRKRVLVEYCLLAGVNAGVGEARELVALLAPLLPYVSVNLIPFNPTQAVEGRGYRAPGGEEVREFQGEVQAGGIFCTVRQEMGRDVNGACGQLALNSQRGAVRDIEDCGPTQAAQPKPVRRRGKAASATSPAVKEKAGGEEQKVPVILHRSLYRPSASWAAASVAVLLLLLWLCWQGG